MRVIWVNPRAALPSARALEQRLLPRLMVKKLAASAARSPGPDWEDVLAEIEAMAVRLRGLRGSERNPAVVDAYRAAFDRSYGLAYRIRNRPTPRVDGFPGRRLRRPRKAARAPVARARDGARDILAEALRG